MSWNAALPANNSLIRLSAGYIRNNQSAMQSVLSATNLTSAISYIPDTAPIWFYTNAAPAGWTATGVGGDSLLAIVGGGVYITGGSQIGTWLGPGYSLLNSDMQSFGPNSGLPRNYVQQFSPDTTYDNTPPTAHHHDWTTTRPMASTGILCTKNPT